MASARLYSLVQRGKANNLNPYTNPRRVFTELPRVQSPADVEALLPTRPTPAELTLYPLRESGSMTPFMERLPRANHRIIVSPMMKTLIDGRTRRDKHPCRRQIEGNDTIALTRWKTRINPAEKDTMR